MNKLIYYSTLVLTIMEWITSEHEVRKYEKLTMQ